MHILLFGKSFQTGPVTPGQINMFGERPNHKYIKREPDPKRPGKYIYYYKTAEGEIVTKDEEGNPREAAQPNVVKEKPAPYGDPMQQEIFEGEYSGVLRKTGDTDAELVHGNQKKEEEKLKKIKYNEVAHAALMNASLLAETYFGKAQEIARKLDLKPIDRTDLPYFNKPKSFLIAEAKKNDSMGRGAVTDGGFIHPFLSDDPEQIVSEYKAKGYNVTPNNDEFVEDEFKHLSFEKFIAEKNNERFEIWTMSDEMHDAFIDTQKKSTNRLKESKQSLALKIEAEKVKELPILLQQYKEKGLDRKELVVIGGLPGSGKTTVLGSSLQKSGVIIDPDSIKFDLGKIRGTDLNDINERPYIYHEESSTVAKHLLREMIRSGKKCVFDGTMKGIANVGDLTELAKSAGYITEAKFIHIPLEEGIKRDRLRGEGGGRSIGEGLYRKLYGAYPTHKSLFQLMPQFNKVHVFDNSTPKDKPAVKIYQKTENNGEKILNKKRYNLVQVLSNVKKAILNTLRKSRFISRLNK